MKHRYIISARKVIGGVFSAEPGRPQFLKCPAVAKHVPSPADVIKSTKTWVQEVRDLADGQGDGRVGDAGDVVIFIHGYNNDLPTIWRRHALLEEDLAAEGFKGVVVSFDWPSANSVLNYIEDRQDAAQTAVYLVSHGINIIAQGQAGGCQTNVHLLGHSTGAYVISEAFIQAEKSKELFQSSWRVSQVALIAGDIASSSLGAADQWMTPLFRRCVRVTNYFSGYDHVLAVSNAKRFGTSPRAGRVGAPRPGAHDKVADVDCSAYFARLDPKESRFEGTFAHSWHVGNRVFARDLALTLTSGIDRGSIPTRSELGHSRFELRDAPRPRFIDDWTRPRG